MGDKRGQLTLFIIIGIVIVVSVVGYFLLVGKSSDDFGSIELNEEYSLLKENVFECQEFINKKMVGLVSLQGGYYEFDDEDVYENLGFVGLPYYYYKGESNLPAIKSFEVNIAKAIDENIIDECINPLGKASLNFELSASEPRTVVLVEEESILIKTNLVVSVIGEEKTASFDLGENEVVLNSKLSDMYNIAQIMVNSEVENPGFLELNEISDIAFEKDIYVDRFGYGENNKTTMTMIYINDSDSFPEILNYLDRFE